MKIPTKGFCVGEGDKVDLDQWPTEVDPVYDSKHDYDRLLKDHFDQISEQRQLHCASNRFKERSLWEEYLKACEACLGAAGTSNSHWYVVPADDKHNARLIVSQIIVDTLEDLCVRYPKISVARERELLSIRKQLST